MILNAMRDLSPLTDKALAAVENAGKSSQPDVQRLAHELAFRPSVQPQRTKGSLTRGIGKLAGLAGLGQTRTAAPSPALTASIEKSLSDPNADVRATAVVRLGKLPAAQALPMIKTAVQDKSPKVRTAALRAVAVVPGDDPAIVDVILAGLKDPDPNVVSAAALAAARRPDPAFGGPVLAALNRPSDKNARGAMLPNLAAAAGAMQLDSATSALILMLADQDPAVKAAAARALGEMRDADSVMALVSILQDAQDPIVMGGVIDALGHFETPAAIEATLRALYKANLPSDVRRAILERVVAEGANPGPWGNWARSGPPLTVSDLRMLSEIARSAGKEMEPGLLSIAQRYLSDPAGGRDARALAAQILVPFHARPEVRAALFSALAQDASGIAPAVAQVIQRERDPRMIASLDTLYRSAIGAQGNADRYPGLAKASPQEIQELRVAIIQGMGNAGGDEGARALRRIITMESDASMTPLIISALERTGSPASVRYLGELASRPTPFATDAIRSLLRVSRLDPDTAAQFLTRVIQTPGTPPDVAAAAADALDEMLVMADV
jgi:hypothetical protein